jgi:hypothetical protein
VRIFCLSVLLLTPPLPPSRYSKDALLQLPRVDLAMALMDYFVKYPLPAKEAALVPFNYCALSKQFPWMQPLLSYVC